MDDRSGPGGAASPPALAARPPTVDPPAVRAVQSEHLAELRREHHARRSGAVRAQDCDDREAAAWTRARAGDPSERTETHGNVEKLRGTFKCHRGSLDFDFKFIRDL